MRALVLGWTAAVVLWALPGPPPGFSEAVRKETAPPVWRNPVAWGLDWKEQNATPRLDSFLTVTGTWQNWNMFAPTPANLSIWVDARVTLRSGREVRMTFPRPESMSLPDRFIRERYRKYLETAHKESAAFLWPPLARWMGERAATDPSDPPVRVRLYRHWREVLPPPERLGPESEFLFYDHRMEPTP